MKKLMSLLSMIIFCAFCLNVNAQTTSFTYQGRLAEASVAANGTYQMQFSLFDAIGGGTQQGSTITNNTVTVTNGVFTVQLDFTAAPFATGADRFIEINVKKPADASFTTLTPRQPITSTPFSQRSQSSATADNATRLGGVAASQYVQTNDTRLTDSRTPTAGSTNYIQNQNATAQAANFYISGNGIVGGPLTANRIFTNSVDVGGTVTTNNLTVGGGVSIRGGLQATQQIEADGGIRSQGHIVAFGGLTTGNNLYLNDTELRLRDSGDSHHSILYDRGIDGIRFNAFNEFQWIRTSNNTELMHLFGNGVLRATGFNGRCVGTFIGSGFCNQDLAETFRTKEQTEAGDVVTIIPEDNERPTVRRSARAYDQHLVGVVSTSPGLVFDEGETKLAGENDKYITKDKTVVAAVGRVPVKFTLENGEINVGDTLTSSAAEPGKAMKATDAGKIIGIALESSAKAKEGKLLMWIQVGHYAPPQQKDELKTIKAENGELKAQLDSILKRQAQQDAQLTALAAQVTQPKAVDHR